MSLEKKNNGKWFFYILLIGFSALLFYLLRSYIGIVILAFAFAIVVQPVYRIFTKRYNWPGWFSTGFIVFLVVTLVLIPLGYFFVGLAGEINNLLIKYKISNVEDVTLELLTAFNQLFEAYPLLEEFKIDEILVVEAVRDFLNSYSQLILDSAFIIGGNTLNFLVKVAVFIIMVFTIIPNLSKVELGLIDTLPLKPEVTKIYIKKFKDFINTFALFWIPIAIIQGLVGGVILLLLRVPNATLYTSLLLLFSLIPVIGPGFVMIPLGIYYIANGQLFVGVAILVCYFLVVSNIDNVLRTIFVSRKVEINPVIMFISFLAGLQIFGIFGIIFGPLIVLMFTTSLDIYKKYYK